MVPAGEFSWPPSFPIEPIAGREPAPIEDLHDEVFTCVAHAMHLLARSKASQQVLLDYLDASRGDVVGGAAPGRIMFWFRSPAGMCDMAEQAATHWSELCLLALRPQLDEVIAELGYRLVDPPSLATVLERGPRHPMLELDELPYCVVRRGPGEAVEIFTDAVPRARSFAELTPAQRKRAAALADGAPCACSLCRRLRRTPGPAIDLHALRARAAASSEASNLTAALRRRDAVRSLHLSGKHLGEVAPEIGRLHRLESLNLSDNGLVALPPEIGALRSLKRLDLHWNRIRRLPDEMRGLAALEELDLGLNALEGLPAWLPSLPRLRALKLSFSPGFPIFAPFPAVLRAMTRLEQLEIVGAEAWRGELEAFAWAELPQLRALTLQNCGLRVVPPALLACRSLARLTLQGGELRELPDEITTLPLTSLVVQSNALTSLPERLGELAMLEELSVGNNPLARLPGSMTRLRRLRSLDLGDTKITELPAQFGDLSDLQLLYLDRCELAGLPASFGRLCGLEHLFMRNMKNAAELLIPHLAALPTTVNVDTSIW